MVGRIEAGPLFRQVRAYFDGSVLGVADTTLHANSVPLISKRLVRAAHAKGLLGEIGEAQLEKLVASISVHSIRVGVAQDTIAVGEGLPAIMQVYRWKDARTVMRYGERLATKSGARADGGTI